MHFSFAYTSSWWQSFRIYSLIFFCLCVSAQSASPLHQYVLVQDWEHAKEEARRILDSPSSSLPLVRLSLKAYLLSKEYSLWASAFSRCCHLHPDLRHDRDVLEDFSIQVLSDGMSHSSFSVRAVSVLAIGMARDFRLVPLLARALYDDSMMVRSLALQVVLLYGSESLKEAVQDLACHDGSMYVRMTAYQVAAALEMTSMIPFLEARVRDSHSVDDIERKEVGRALCLLTKHPCDQAISNEIEQAIHLCERIKEGREHPQEQVMLDLLQLPSPEVQEQVLLTLLTCGRGLFAQAKPVQELVLSLAKSSPFPKVRLQAAAVLYLHENPLGETLLVQGLCSQQASVCEAASEAVCSLGIHGTSLAQSYLSSVTTKAAMNLAILLLVSRQHVEAAGDVVARYMVQPEMCWAIEHFLFDKSVARYPDLLPLYSDVLLKKEVGRKLIRLLVLAQYSQVKKVTTQFLLGKSQEKRFFSHVLAEEGLEQMQEDKGVENFASRLEDVLSSLGQRGESQAIQDAIELYTQSRWQDKLAILEALALSENLEATEFLLSCCQKELPSLRVAAAGALFALFH